MHRRRQSPGRQAVAEVVYNTPVKTFLAVIACIGQISVVVFVVTWLRGAVSVINTNAALNALFILISLADITIVNYWVWKKIRSHSAPR